MIELKGISKVYQKDALSVDALMDVDLTVKQGEFVAVVGKSGSGKSTLMNIIGCLDKPTCGSYFLNGRDIVHAQLNELSEIRLKQIGFIFQNFSLIARLTALENVELPLTFAGMEKGKRRELAKTALERVGLSDRMEHRPAELSGGQQQRVAIARAIVGKPSVILADEPTGNLDPVSGGEIMELLLGLHKAGHTILLITHDVQTARAAQRIVRIAGGRITGDREKTGGLDQIKSEGKCSVW